MLLGQVNDTRLSRGLGAARALLVKAKATVNRKKRIVEVNEVVVAKVISNSALE